MVVAENLNYTFHQTPTGDGWDGVVRISSEGYYGTGVLLYSGNTILTVAHLLQSADGILNNTATVTFETETETLSLTTSQYVIHPDYDPANGNDDLALLFLPEAVPVDADRYQIYHGTDEINKKVTLVGYGSSGTGATGASPDSQSVRYKALNTFDVSADQFLEDLDRSVGWNPENMLIADFDSGQSINDTLGRITEKTNLGTGYYEGIIAPGDSGGPALIDGKIAGIANYIVRMEGDFESSDIDDIVDSSFGELGFWSRISSEQQWIDQSVRSYYPDAPQSPEDVLLTIDEGDTGTSLLYFMVQFHGERDSAAPVLSIDYTTRDGTATTGEDYIATSGTLNLYPGETQALIPVEVIGDMIAEGSETLYLDIFNPQGGSFAGGVEMLSAMRTIMDDDGWA